MPGPSPIPSPAASTPERLSPAPAPAGNDAERRIYNSDTAPLAAMTLSQLLDAQKSRDYWTHDIWRALVDPQTYASRELRLACESACPNGPLFLQMATLLTTPEEERTLDRLIDVGIFVLPERARQLRADDAALLRSDEGLKLWLQYAASPTCYQSVFDGSDVFGEATTKSRARIDKILRVLVAVGRDATDATPANPTATTPRNPLAHLCSQTAPQWLRRLFQLGACPEQMNDQGMPLTVVAMRAQALRLYTADHDPLDAHDSLHQLAQLLRRQGADLAQSNRDGMPAPALLTFHGLGGAAEALLAAGADPNVPDRNGNTLMHHLAYVVRLQDDPASIDCACLARHALVVASCYDGDMTRPNHAGQTPRSWIPEPLPAAPQFGDPSLDAVRTTARRRIRALI
ncbi:hypothetical protein [Pandoraea terrigena]|uniref:Ankyrin n=1 Tax=Pandoraea terrigena TaxID=2508292 RepID=A0A5E4XTU4_9BURK|nr:hypothetical protein [Pandoraea terrigena]VVE39760.1 ankyrin [Pandoraea terrigena]